MSEFTKNSNRFIFFGCWNSLNKKSNLENTMSTLTNYLKENPEIPFVVVGGDNFYPDKSKKKEQKEEKKDKEEKKEKKEKKDKEKDEKKEDICTKIINLDNLTDGFNLLPKNISILMLLGNHDLETNVENEQKFCIQNNENPNPIVEPPNTCTILQHEKHLVSLNNNITLGMNVVHRINNTLYLTIDTSMYDTKESESYIPCYQRHYEETIDLTNRKEYINQFREDQNRWIVDNIDKYVSDSRIGIKNIIIMGHHPITGHKVKDDKCILTKLEQPFVEMWQSVLDIVDPDIRLHYLCADIHNYQHSIIHFTTHLTKPIHQYIVGTGGTELDSKDHLNCPNIMKDDALVYGVIEQRIKNGFLDCDCSGERPTFIFIETINPMKAEGNKTKKHKKNRKKPSRKLNPRS